MSIIAGYLAENYVLLCGDTRIFMEGNFLMDGFDKVFQMNENVMWAAAGNYGNIGHIMANLYGLADITLEGFFKMQLERDDSLTVTGLYDYCLTTFESLKKYINNKLNDEYSVIFIGGIEDNVPKMMSIVISNKIAYPTEFKIGQFGCGAEPDLKFKFIAEAKGVFGNWQDTANDFADVVQKLAANDPRISEHTIVKAVKITKQFTG